MIVIDCETLLNKRRFRVVVRRQNPATWIYQTYVFEGYDITPIQAIKIAIDKAGSSLYDVEDITEKEWEQFHRAKQGPISLEMEGG